MFREITSHKANDCNDRLTIKALDEPGVGGASQLYEIRGFNSESNPSCPFMGRYGKPADHSTVLFQNGPPDELGVNGVTMEALLAILQDRLEGFQAGPYACRENGYALLNIKDAMHWLHQRSGRLAVEASK